MSLAALCATLAACGGGGSGGSRLIGSGSTGGGTNTGSGAPSGLTATATSSTEIALQWTDNASDEDGFRLERRSQRLPWTTVAQLPADTTSYTDTALSANTTYTYRVTATRGGADIGTSNEASATTLAPTNTCTEWTLSNGSTDEDRVQGVAFDPARDRLYVVGTTQGALGGPQIGGRDAFLQAYDATGKLVWQTQFGSSLDDWATAVAVDRAGNVYVAGFTEDKVAGQSAGARDAFVHRFPPTGGRPNWTGHYGTGRDDHASCVAVSPQGKVVLGGTSRNPGIGNEQDPWLAQFDPGAGANPVWTWKSGNGFFNENLVDLAINPNNGDVYAIGRTQVVMPNVVGSPPNANNVWAVGDIYVARVDATGTEKWIVQIGSGCGMGAQSKFNGTGGDIPGGVAVSETGEIYVTGFAQGEAAGPGSYLGPDANTHRPPSQLCNAQDWNVWGDVVLFQLDNQGIVQWVEQFGTAESDRGTDVTVSGGKVYVCGATRGDMSTTGSGNHGGIDRFVAAYSTTGTFEWIRQSGTAEDDWNYDIATDGNKGIYVVGASGPTTNPTDWEPHIERLCD